MEEIRIGYDYCNIFRMYAVEKELEGFFDGFSLQSLEVWNGTVICTFFNSLNESIRMLNQLHSVDLEKASNGSIEHFLISDDLSFKKEMLDRLQKGFRYTCLEKQYVSSYSSSRDVLVHLKENRYGFSDSTVCRMIPNVSLSDLQLSYLLVYLRNPAFQKEISSVCDIHSNFEIRMEHPFIDSAVFYDDYHYAVDVSVNGKDISSAYATIFGIDTVARIYDLYCGILTPKNEKDMDSIHEGKLSAWSFGLREMEKEFSLEKELLGEPLVQRYSNFIPYLEEYFARHYSYFERIEDSRDSILKGMVYSLDSSLDKEQSCSNSFSKLLNKRHSSFKDKF